MEENIYITQLFDYYAELLTDKQREYFSDYYIENFSLSEIAENYCVSRNAVFKQVKEAENKLKFYEEKLHLLQNSIEISKLLEQIKDERIKEQIEKLI
ncbi:MAG: hypothetical protein E7173_03060 [Firmicutes bacterium]|nr:hypothetical protein [Bacillota bacterium]